MRTTKTQINGAFKRLHRAMEWPDLQPYNNIAKGANVGAIYLADTGLGFAIEVIVNEGGGVHAPFGSWRTKHEAFETMAAMASAVEEYKRKH